MKSNQSINQSINQPINESINQSINQSTKYNQHLISSHLNMPTFTSQQSVKEARTGDTSPVKSQEGPTTTDFRNLKLPKTTFFFEPTSSRRDIIMLVLFTLPVCNGNINVALPLQRQN